MAVNVFCLGFSLSSIRIVLLVSRTSSTSVSCCAFVGASRTGRVGEVELGRMQKESIGVANIELFLLFEETIALVVELGYEATTYGVREVFMFVFG